MMVEVTVSEFLKLIYVVTIFEFLQFNKLKCVICLWGISDIEDVLHHGNP